MKTCLGDHLHTNLGFACQRPQVFAEVRYGLAPSVVQRLDFEDIREGRAGVIQVDPQTRVVQQLARNNGCSLLEFEMHLVELDRSYCRVSMVWNGKPLQNSQWENPMPFCASSLLKVHCACLPSLDLRVMCG